MSSCFFLFNVYCYYSLIDFVLFVLSVFMGNFPIICQNICRYVLKSKHMKKFFDYMQIPEFDVAADATATFKVIISDASLFLCMFH